MPRCPAHCPPDSSGPLLAAAIIAAVLVIAATWTVIVQVLTILLITLGVAAALVVAGLAPVVVLRLRGIARDPSAPGRNPQARTGTPRTIPAAAVDQRQITANHAPAAGCQQGSESGHRPVPAIEQHWHLHLHDTSLEQPAPVLGQTPGRMAGAPKEPPIPRDGGHRDA